MRRLAFIWIPFLLICFLLETRAHAARGLHDWKLGPAHPDRGSNGTKGWLSVVNTLFRAGETDSRFQFSSMKSRAINEIDEHRESTMT